MIYKCITLKFNTETKIVIIIIIWQNYTTHKYIKYIIK